MKLSAADIKKDSAILNPIIHKSRHFYLTIVVFSGIFIFSLVVYALQLKDGLGVTGMHQRVTWGFYIINFVFFIGISHAGTLISAILRLSKAEWRRPITRMAEVITAIVLLIGGVYPIIDLGRPDRILHILYNGRLQSPLLWDVASITAYFTASTVYLFLPLIPDMAILRDIRVKPHWLYQFLSWGWNGSEEHQKILNRAINIMMIVVIPIAVSVHTVISYIFAMTLEPGWHSTIFGPYFVAGAIFSGIAALLLVMIFFRKIFQLQNYLKQIHFNYLGMLLLIMSLLWAYFTFSEYLTAYYGHEPQEMRVFYYKILGHGAPFFWLMVLCNFMIPVFLLRSAKKRTIRNIGFASSTVIVGMWLERFIIVVPSLANPRLPYLSTIYIPTFTEWMIFAGSVSLFILGFVLFSHFFPIISIWELEEGRKEGVDHVISRIKSYLPGKP